MGNSYRIYRIDRANHVVEVDWITAESDEQAVAAARAMNKPGKREVWHADRLVATIPIAAAEKPSSSALWL